MAGNVWKMTGSSVRTRLCLLLVLMISGACILLLQLLFLKDWEDTHIVDASEDDNHYFEDDQRRPLGESHPPVSCTWGARRRLVHKVCQDLSGERQADMSALVNGGIASEQEAFYYCLIYKSATKAGEQFFADANANRQLLFHHIYGVEDREFTADAAPFRRFRDMPFSEVLATYGNFTRMVIVRHPLQRFVSAYYQLAVAWGNPDKPQNFTSWVEQTLTRGKRNMHWLDYQNSCEPCTMDYDYILKMENLVVEMADLKREMGWGMDVEHPVKHINPHFDNTVYKYDAMLTELERDRPDLFRQVLDKYSWDMKMFGYTWQDHRSGCHSELAECC